MHLLESILETIFGKVHFVVTVGNKPAIEIKLHNKEILIDIKNPILAIEFGLEELLEYMPRDKGGNKGDGESPESMLKKLKSMGYTIKVKYKIFELDL
jgi:hypothetical protein